MNLLQEHPRWVEHEKAVAEAKDRARKVRAQAAQEDAAYRAALDAHRVAVEEAVQAGDPIPVDEAQRSRSFEHALQIVRHEQEALYEAGRNLQADLLPELETAARERWEARKAALAEAVAALADATSVLRSDARVLSEARALADNRKKAIPRPNAGERTKTRWDVPDLVDVLQEDRDPFALMPLTYPSSGPLIEDGHGGPESSPPKTLMRRHKQAGFSVL